MTNNSFALLSLGISENALFFNILGIFFRFVININFIQNNVRKNGTFPMKGGQQPQGVF